MPTPPDAGDRGRAYQPRLPPDFPELAPELLKLTRKRTPLTADELRRLESGQAALEHQIRLARRAYEAQHGPVISDPPAEPDDAA